MVVLVYGGCGYQYRTPAFCLGCCISHSMSALFHQWFIVHCDGIGGSWLSVNSTGTCMHTANQASEKIYWYKSILDTAVYHTGILVPVS
jgi:hypothetical protein